MRGRSLRPRRSVVVRSWVGCSRRPVSWRSPRGCSATSRSPPRSSVSGPCSPSSGSRSSLRSWRGRSRPRSELPPGVLGMTGRLGQENAKRNPRRTASTAAALMIGLGLVVFVSVFMTTLKASASDTLDETLRADFILSSSGFQPFSPGIARALSERRRVLRRVAVPTGRREDRRRADLHRRRGRDDDRRRGVRADGGGDTSPRWPSRGRS